MHQIKETISMTNIGHSTLHLLSDRHQTVGRSDDDVRGRKVQDKNGASIGRVADLLVDDQEQKVRFLLVEHGGFFGFDQTSTLVPVDSITSITADELVVDQSREHIAAAPGYAPHLVDDRAHHISVYRHYGREPYWSQDYEYPPQLSLLPMMPPRAWV